MTQWDTTALPKPTQDLARLRSDLDTFGYCFIASAFSKAQVRALKERLAEQAEAERKHGYNRLNTVVQDAAGMNQWVNLLVNKGSVFIDAVFQPHINAVVAHLLGTEYLLSEISAHITRPGNALLPLHTDQWWMPEPVLPGERYQRCGDMTRDNVRTGAPVAAKTPIVPPLCVNAMTMVTDFTEENGATRIVPGSHLTGTQPDPSVPHRIPSVAGTGEAGTVLVWEGRTWHSAGANTSNGDRYGMTSLWSGPQMRTLQNFTLATRPEVLKDASPELLKLLGFKVWFGYGQTDMVGMDYARPAAEMIGALKP
ncbi:MAG: phytanoyl-CoA dioxygenase family protein [Alphaproteobacteria bacterium]